MVLLNIVQLASEAKMGHQGKIPTKGPPIRKKPYKTPYHLRSWVDKQIKDMETQGVIKEAVSEWCHQINQATIFPNPDKLEIIKQLKPLNNQKTCRSVCGVLSYFQCYVQNYTSIAKPLTNLLKTSENFECPPEAVEALSRLKQELLKAPVKITDASSVSSVINGGIGAVLFNINHNGKESIVQYTSRALSEDERKDSTIERERLAVVVYMEHF
ncbi:hypothetical protein QYM36_000559 [Artemia franciscana]|uniref:Reverse transcriptase/retrotransposon-derived protein RNase H-like domain-containing protein n=1 Tax=Artemia franciscana TaxID=6661 RepID=A0AA88IG53_ARTSF|nr:hypothetical protein QYM36_000559 [Artemia franciscana]